MPSRSLFDRLAGPTAVVACLLAPAACSGVALDEPDFTQTEEATAYSTGTPEGACLAAVAEGAPGAALQVVEPGRDIVRVTADDALWTCRMSPDGSVSALLPPEKPR